MSTANQLSVRRELAEHRALQVRRIPLPKLRAHPRYVRRDLGDLAELADSLSSEGQHQLIVVERRGSFFQILDGHRLLGAATIAGLRGLNAKIVHAVTDVDALSMMLAAGVHAKPLTKLERTHAVRALIDDENMKDTEIALRCGVTLSTIRRWYNGDVHPQAPEEPSSCIPRQRLRASRPRTIGVRRINALADRWTDQCAQGLSAERAQALLGELRALVAGSS